LATTGEAPAAVAAHRPTVPGGGREPEAWTRLAGRLERAGGAVTLVWVRLTGAQLLARLRDRESPAGEPER
jgi:hypothetical protein